MAGGGYRWLHEDDQKVLQARWATWISRESVGGGGGVVQARHQNSSRTSHGT